jgi:hypothetical protein
LTAVLFAEISLGVKRTTLGADPSPTKTDVKKKWI